VRFVHVGEDSLFLGRFSAWFEQVLPGASTYVVMTQPGSSELRFAIAAARVEVVVSRGRGLATLVRAVRAADVVVIHSMGLFGALATTVARRSAKVMWSGFGGDYYGTSMSRDDDLLGALTMRAKASIEPRASLIQRADAALREWRKGAAARRADYFSAPIPADFAVFRRRFPSFTGTYAQLNYATVSDMRPSMTNSAGPDILVGNSASYANNHLEVFDALADLDLRGRRVVAPLSYGESEAYRQLVIAAGRAQFGDAFVPLTDYLPLGEYVELLASCGHVVMGHRRQQALGNVVGALCSGADIVLDARNPIALTLLDEGARIRTLDDLRTTGFPEHPLSAAQAHSNRRVAERLWSDAVVTGNITAFIDRTAAELHTETTRR
jgi:hypothetical protein